MVDALYIAIAVGFLFAFARRPRPVHPATALLLTLITAAWLWANLRVSPMVKDSGVPGAPRELDPITRAMFHRGWPLAPWMICLLGGSRADCSGFEGLLLVVDWILFLAALSFTEFVCEWYVHRRDGNATAQDVSRPGADFKEAKTGGPEPDPCEIEPELGHPQ